MSAVLKFSRVPKPAARPAYRRPDLLNFRDDWLAKNMDLLLAWFGDGDLNDFEMFAHNQHERERDQHDAFKDTYRGP